MNYFWSSGIFCKEELKRIYGRDANSHERVILCLLRISRGKYLTGNQVSNIATNLSRCIDGRHWFITHRVFLDEDMYKADYVGLLNGDVLFQHGGEGFYKLLRLQETNRKAKIPIELKILNLILKEMKNGN